jgi:hypothetical protein
MARLLLVLVHVDHYARPRESPPAQPEEKRSKNAEKDDAPERAADDRGDRR